MRELALAVVFAIGGVETRFHTDPAFQLTISASCVREGAGLGEPLEKRLSCKAYDALKSARGVKLGGGDGLGGRNPGSMYCKKLGGKVVVAGRGATLEQAMAKSADEQTFCEFDDGSRVDCGTIFHWATAR